MTSLIATKASGQMCQGQVSIATTVKVEIQDTNLVNYGMVANGFNITESENTSVTSSIGKNLFVYCTNSAPVQITLRGVIGEIVNSKTSGSGKSKKGKQEIKQFPKFYEDCRVGKEGKVLKITIDGTAYRAVLLSYTRNYNTTPSVTDEASLTFLAVREEQEQK